MIPYRKQQGWQACVERRTHIIGLSSAVLKLRSMLTNNWARVFFGLTQDIRSIHRPCSRYIAALCWRQMSSGALELGFVGLLACITFSSMVSCKSTKDQQSTSKPRPLAHFLANTIFKKLSLPSPLICLTKSLPLIRPRSTAFCSTYIASRQAASSAVNVQSCCATSVGATKTSSIGGCFLLFASVMTWLQSCMLRCSILSFDDNVASRFSN